MEQINCEFVTPRQKNVVHHTGVFSQVVSHGTPGSNKRAYGYAPARSCNGGIVVNNSSAWQICGWIPRNSVTKLCISRSSTVDLTATWANQNTAHHSKLCYQEGDNCKIYFHIFYRLFMENVRVKY
jgi:hypothetical protein